MSEIEKVFGEVVEEKKIEPLSFEEGLIGSLERFLKRYPIGPMFRRSVGISLVSAHIPYARVEDQWGPVKANVWFLYPGPSGLGYKSPILRFVRYVVRKTDPSILCPTRFTAEAFTEWVTGTYKKKKEDREEVEPHYVNFPIIDEFSKIMANFADQSPFAPKEFLSQLWDGYIEGAYTRSFQYEGNVEVYVPLIGACSDILFKIMDEDFFTQGLGNRILWILEPPVEPKPLDQKDFFFDLDKRDEERDILVDNIVKKLTYLQDNVRGAYLGDEEGRKLWVDFQYEFAKKAYDSVLVDPLSSSFGIKQPLNALKLAMVYSASRLDVHFNCLNVRGEDMRRAIEDIRKYTEMWRGCMGLLGKYRSPRLELRIQSVKYDLKAFIDLMRKKEGLACIREIGAAFDLSDKGKIRDVLSLGVDKGWIEILVDAGCLEEFFRQHTDLSKEQYRRFKLPGPSPTIYRLTKEGWGSEL